MRQPSRVDLIDGLDDDLARSHVPHRIISLRVYQRVHPYLAPSPTTVGVTWPDGYRGAGSCS